MTTVSSSDEAKFQTIGRLAAYLQDGDLGGATGLLDSSVA
ncbi:MAG: hypothetical protein FD160_1236 [Caulobacteraceae bacterium]|nr:MAG: hypothetical protein FD160_1236 [Caulobacteraceae bacterium]